MSFSDYATALVTGGSSGIGAGVVERLAREGLKVYAVGRRVDRLAELSAKTGCEIVAVDVRDTAALRDAVVHLAVLDVSMPGLSGLDVYARARESGWDGAVLFVSGFADQANVARMGGNLFLAKPFGAEELRDQVARILDAETDKPSLASRA